MTIFKMNNYLIWRNAPGPLKGFLNLFCAMDADLWNPFLYNVFK